ncbi:hypothetical protein [Lentzea sp. NPDC060358]|uniref:hypothetical protein n=1 Tax=Lentzea sp. NPDC060358 TaxID=3347103 RepID=UPI003662BA71
MPVLDRPLRIGDQVAVLDDNAKAANALRWLVDEAGFDPILIKPNPRGVEEMVKEIVEKAAAAISDHRLGHAGPISYSGAEVVARANVVRIPAILITSYANSDENTTIRQWRSGIPQMLNRGSEGNSPDLITQALAIADDERRGIYLPQRKAYRTVVRVEDTRDGPDGLIAEVVVTAWRPQQTVSIPVSLIGDLVKGIPPRRLKRRRFMAEVNIYAETAGELFFREFEPAPDIPEDWLPTV